ncbi:MAG: ABC transporter permease [Puniceicoccales bacterium]|jgi:phospholipid/cholesterol/gamma-HCH transport system permease protein|nr:ABC transporter permease [Puniceicoccales bacterium]
MLKLLRKSVPPTKAIAEVVSSDTDCHVVRLAGEWNIRASLLNVGSVLDRLLAQPQTTLVVFETSGLQSYDSSLVAYLMRLYVACTEKGIKFERESLPSGVNKLLELALSRPQKVAEEHAVEIVTVFHRVGIWGESAAKSWMKAVDFIGQTVLAFWNLLRGKARTRLSECWIFIQSVGVDALPIISLISFLTGLILAYVGAVQMKQFGATVYVAGLVALAMVREMGVLMASIILCGRTATAFAAQLGSMQASEEIAAFRVLGISPVEYLVLPRMIAMVLMLPILTLYSNFCGIMGGLVVVTSMDVTIEQYYNMTIRSVNIPNFSSGLIKSFFFAILISWAGCFRGMACGKSAQAVGDATTSAAVLGITLVVIADAVFAVLFDAINFF